VEVEIYPINKADVPIDDLTPDQIFGLMPLIVETKAPKPAKEKKE
jgi:hypothetical protein